MHLYPTPVFFSSECCPIFLTLCCVLFFGCISSSSLPGGFGRGRGKCDTLKLASWLAKPSGTVFNGDLVSCV